MPLPALLKIPNRSNIYVYIFVVKLQNTNTRKAEGKKKTQYETHYLCANQKCADLPE